MKSRLFLVLFLALLSCSFLLAEGRIAGRITDEAGNEQENVTLLLEGTNLGAYSKENGTYLIQNVPTGNHKITATLIGFRKQTKEITVEENQTITVNFKLIRESIMLQGVTVTANHAIERETPVAFKNVTEEDLQYKYTTEDMPMLLDDIPGVFSSSDGLGEADITIRGFDAEKVQILINGIPVNDPESQIVYWSNWTGLSSSVKNVQVQRGAGSSLYGSGAFGGSVNIETYGTKKIRELQLRSSIGFYTTEGAKKGYKTKVADGVGGFENYDPVNYNLIVKYNSGPIQNGKYSYSLMMERKAGDYYVNGTNYDGYSFGVDAEAILLPHKLQFSFIGAPQKHNQASNVMDIDLMNTLGREYNRRNNANQENFYFKPQFSLRDEWKIDDSKVLMTNFFLTFGGGGGKYMYNDYFDTATGEVRPRDVDELQTNRAFGENARWIYENTGVILDGYDPVINAYNGVPVSVGTNLTTNNHDLSWINTGYNNHFQYGLNTYFDYTLNEKINLVIGGEMRNWYAEHLATSEELRYYDPSQPNNTGVYDKVQRRYDYDSNVINFSGFMRTKVKPIENLYGLLDLQYAVYTSKVEENPIRIFDYQTGAFIDETYYQTKDIMEEVDGVMKRKFSDSDYEKTYSFLSPKAGLNYNISKYFNVRTNFSIAYKEPKVSDWYNRSSGPNQNQVYSTPGVELKQYQELDPEKATTYEIGVAYDGIIFDVDLNLYHTAYEDKIERVTDEILGQLTINAGKAVHKGIELDFSANYQQIDLSISSTLANNRWESMRYQKIFNENASDVKDKVVPFSPEKMASFNLGYTFEKLPLDGKFRIGTSMKWWDDYFASYTNKYKVLDSDGGLTVEKDAKLPYYLQNDLNFKYDMKIAGHSAAVKLDLNNIFNRSNYSKASYSADYGRNDVLNGEYYMYVSAAPLFNIFLTTEISF